MGKGKCREVLRKEEPGGSRAHRGGDLPGWQMTSKN